MPSPEFRYNTHCGTCSGACCQNMFMPLTADEAAFLRQAGTVLHPVKSPSGYLKTGQKEYDMPGKCGYLRPVDVTRPNGPQLCTAYDNPRKPTVCNEFEEDGSGCRNLRRMRNIEIVYFE